MTVSASACEASPATKPAQQPIANGDWAQIAYYNSEKSTSHGVTFLNDKGDGVNSGVWDE